MIEKKLFQEISGKRNDFHSAILTSFSFNFHHFEFQVLRTLRQKWVTNVAVLVDQDMLDDSIGLATGNLKQLSESYSVNGIKSKGAFHPKLNFLVGDNKLLLFFGSGNITPGGHGKNHELFTAFYSDSVESPQRPILIEAWDYLQSLTNDISGFNKERISRQIALNTALLKRTTFVKHNFHKLENDIEVALLYHEERSSILSQIMSLIPKGEITKVTIVCPYYDDDGITLMSLVKQFKNSEFDIYIPNEFGLPPTKIPKEGKMNFYAWEATERAKEEIGGSATYVRKLHSKIFHFQSKQHQYFILGSANATKAGLGTLEERGVNDEFCALYKANNFDFLKQIGIKGKKTKIDVHGMSRSSLVIPEEGSGARNKYLFYITGVDLQGYTLTIYLKNISKIPGCSIIVYGSSGDELFRHDYIENNSLEVSIRLHDGVSVKKLSYLDIVDDHGKTVSNKQLINSLEKLSFTDPSKANRSINQVIYGFETGAINEFEILEYLNQLNSSEPLADTQGQSQKSRLDNKEASFVEMTYERAIEASKELQQKQKIASSHNSVRLWESISRLLKSNIQRRDDELDNEEEEAKAEASNERSVISNHMIVKPKVSKVEQLINQVEELVLKYKKSVSSISNISNHKIGVIDFAQFLLVSHVVTMLTFFNAGNVITGKNSAERLKGIFKHLMMDILISFNKLLISKSLEKYSETERFYGERLRNYQMKVIYNSLFFIHLIDLLNREKFINTKLELISFNMFRRLGLSDMHFEQYLNDISRTEDEIVFNVQSTIRLKDSLENKYIELGVNENYFWLNHSGFCMIEEKKEKQISYVSIHGSYNTSNNDYLNYRRPSK